MIEVTLNICNGVPRLIPARNARSVSGGSSPSYIPVALGKNPASVQNDHAGGLVFPGIVQGFLKFVPIPANLTRLERFPFPLSGREIETRLSGLNPWVEENENGADNEDTWDLFHGLPFLVIVNSLMRRVHGAAPLEC